MTVIDDFFKKLDTAKKDRYTSDSGDYCELLFATIGKKFDREKELKIQMKGLTQKQFEKMRDFIVKDILDDNKRDLEKESSVKVVLSKILESFILKDLETFFDYNIYNDKKRRIEKRTLDDAIAYLYTLQESKPFITAEEINIKIDNKLYEKVDEIKDVLAKSIKKEKRAILLNNITLNESILEEKEKALKLEGKDLVNGRYSKSLRKYLIPCLCPEYIRDISSYTTEQLNIVTSLQSIPFIAHSLKDLPITDKKIILKNFLLKKEPFYFLNHKILKSAENNTKIFLNLSYDNIEKITRNRYKDKTTGVIYEFDYNVLKHYEILLNKKISRIHSIRCKLGKIYMGEQAIKDYLENSPHDNVFQVRFKRYRTTQTLDLICSYNFGLFFLLNQNIIKDVYYEDELVPKDNYIIRPRNFSTIAFSEYVDNFLEVMNKDYNLTYKNKKILDLNAGFIRGKAPYVKKELAQSKKQFEDMVKYEGMLTRLFPAVLED